MAVRIVGTRKNYKKTIFISVLVLLFLGGVFYAVNRIISGYEMQIAEYETNRKKVFTPIKDIKYNTMIEEEMFKIVEVYSSLPSEYYISRQDFGKISNINMKAGIPAMKFMVADEEVANDVREEEFNMFFLQSNLAKNDFIDLRICFPNGEDYIVLSKKMVKDISLKQNTIWTWLNEEEIVTISSAIVDAYLHKGTKLYIVKYVQPNTQTLSTPTYTVNLSVQRVMANNPNILEKAGMDLAAQVRAELDQRLANLSLDSLSSVSTGIAQDFSSRKNIIEQQKQLTRQQSTQEQSTQRQSTQQQSDKQESAQQETREQQQQNEGSENGGFY